MMLMMLIFAVLTFFSKSIYSTDPMCTAVDQNVHDITIDSDIKLYKTNENKNKAWDCTLNLKPDNKYKIASFVVGNPTATGKVTLTNFQDTSPMEITDRTNLGAFVSKNDAAASIKQAKDTVGQLLPAQFIAFLGCGNEVNVPDSDSFILYHLWGSADKKFLKHPSPCVITLKTKAGRKILINAEDVVYGQNDCSKEHMKLENIEGATSSLDLCKKTESTILGNNIKITMIGIATPSTDANRPKLLFFSYNDRLTIGQLDVTLKNEVKIFSNNKDEITTRLNGITSTLWKFAQPPEHAIVQINKFDNVVNNAVVVITAFSNAETFIQNNYYDTATMILDKAKANGAISVKVNKDKLAPIVRFIGFLLCGQTITPITPIKELIFNAFSVPDTTKQFIKNQYISIENCELTVKTDDSTIVKINMKELDLKDKNNPCADANDHLSITNIEGKSEAQKFCDINQWGKDTSKSVKTPIKVKFTLKTLGDINKFYFSFLFEKITTISPHSKTASVPTNSTNTSTVTNFAARNFVFVDAFKMIMIILAVIMA